MKRTSEIVENLLEADGPPLFGIHDVAEWVSVIKAGINAPVVNVGANTFGGSERVTIMILVVLDEKSTWINNIMENARYLRFHMYRDGTLECFAASGPKPTYRFVKKFRKTRVKSAGDAVSKINQFIADVS